MAEFRYVDEQSPSGRPPVNTTLTKLRARQPVFGTWVSGSRDPAIMRMIAAAGFDFVFLDMEHSALSWETLGDHCNMARASGLTPIIRTYGHDPAQTARALDLGAMGIMHPMVNTPGQVRELLDAALYQPAGSRGSTALSAPQDYLRLDPATMKTHLNDIMLTIVQVEDVQAVDRIEELAAVDGLDLVEIGREDLSTSMGLPLQVRHDQIMKAIERVATVCRTHGVAVGVNCSSMDDARELLDAGVTCFSYLSDQRILLTAYYDAAAGFRRLLTDPRQPQAPPPLHPE
jgi:4-hydroxy-2-oxoheptanedioate aldolase